MKHKVALLIFAVGIVILFWVYFVPKINERTDLDRLETAFAALRNQIPEDQTVWFFSKDIEPGPPGTYYKTQFVLAPNRVIMPGTFDDIPPGDLVVLVDDKSKAGNEIKTDHFTDSGGTFSVDREGYIVTLLTKK